MSKEACQFERVCAVHVLRCVPVLVDVDVARDERVEGVDPGVARRVAVGDVGERCVPDPQVEHPLRGTEVRVSVRAMCVCVYTRVGWACVRVCAGCVCVCAGRRLNSTIFPEAAA